MYHKRYTRKPEQPAGSVRVESSASAPNAAPCPYMTVKELQEHLHICRRTAYTLVHKEGFPAYKVDGSVRIDRKELENWIHAQKAA